MILPSENFYGFKIFPDQESKMEIEREEIERLLRDSNLHGKWYIKNFDSLNKVMNLPVAFDKEYCQQIKNLIFNVKSNILLPQMEMAQSKYKNDFGAESNNLSKLK